MLTPIPWFQRTFEFKRTPAEAPTIIARLLGAPARLEDLTRGIEERIMRRRPAGLEGKLLWSVFDHAGHLADIDDLHFRRFKEILASVETMSPAEKDNLSTTAAHYNRQPLGPILARFRTERTTMINFLSNLTEEDFGKSSRHPRLGAAMRVIDVAEFVAEHDDHHLAVIRDLIWNPASHGAQQAY